MNIITCQQYAHDRSIAVSTATLHARQLGIKPIAGRYLFTARDCRRLDALLHGRPGRPRRATS